MSRIHHGVAGPAEGVDCSTKDIIKDYTVLGYRQGMPQLSIDPPIPGDHQSGICYVRPRSPGY